MASSRHCVTIDALKLQVLPSVMHLLDTDTVTLSLTVSVTDSLTGYGTEFLSVLVKGCGIKCGY